ncbi:nucleic acid binding OB-fold tRNA/helicase-type [Beutenbergia cavernae DSM 12333]|uniref:Nucleic acid binding OB-fold tRNA/helicase-type n=1 Tax=Beutenbergia cavernae (strain ATCC BAA-8 / DSM 12333 / CCUG 43141 / JCM 11478 / NBRC 16432 / NCIMB 13614 / HKI 0122) TaxID=471853 RepID=C5C5K4_BEUC1|nr:OB-fold nucleic acid binding domain-containing protein [Beutenbergia cavernae]ACQ80195.1 nucleic acid binding OB-fold tRNA/helicase-type [Beutenbergia cavernae DSM 12333]
MTRAKGTLASLFASQAEIEADDEREQARGRGCAPVAELAARRRAHVAGVLRSVTYQPRGVDPALTAELYDGSGSVDLVWLGRREIAGIEPGRRLVVDGMVCSPEPGRPRLVMYNPAYDLLPREGE